MSKNSAISVICTFLLVACGIKTYNQAQYSECFSSYKTAVDACNDDEECEGNALSAYRGCMGENVKIPLHFVVLTEKLSQQLASPTDNDITIGFLKNEVDTLNRYFSVENVDYPPDNRQKILTFEYKSSTLFDVTATLSDPLTNFAIPEFNFDRRHEDFKPTMNSNTDPLLYDPTAVNVYIVDCVDASGADIVSSHGNNYSNKPYIVLDYARITGVANRQAAEEHEMGHAFGLGHVCDPNATTSSSTNIMASKNNCTDSNGNPSSGGKRDIGFSQDQCMIILDKANEFLSLID